MDVSPVAMLIALIVHQGLGFLWFGPLFGKAWTAALGKTMEELTGPATGIIIAIVMGIIVTLSLSLLVSIANVRGAVNGAALGALAGIGFVAATTFTNATFENRSRTATLIFVSYEVIALILMGAIIGHFH